MRYRRVSSGTAVAALLIVLDMTDRQIQLRKANLQREFSRSAGAQPQDLLFGIALFTQFFVFARGGAFAVVALFQSLNEAKRRAIEIPLGAQLIFQEALEIEMQRLFLVGEEQENRRG